MSAPDSKPNILSSNSAVYIYSFVIGLIADKAGYNGILTGFAKSVLYAK